MEGKLTVDHARGGEATVYATDEGRSDFLGCERSEGLEGGTEGAEVAETYGCAVLDGADDDVFEGVEHGLDVGRGYGTLAFNLDDDVLEGEGGGGCHLGIELY